MTAFQTVEEACTFLSGEIDRPTTYGVTPLSNDSSLRVTSYELDDGSFTNSYDVSYNPDIAHAQVLVHEDLQSVGSVVRAEHTIALSGGFFFLADRASAKPRQVALNLAIADGIVRSLPVVDRETLLCRDGRLAARQLRALGNLSLNDAELTWAGSLTEHESDCSIYSNGNVVITHEPSRRNGTERVLAEMSRYTPPIMGSDNVDIGLKYCAIQRAFVGSTVSTDGRVDIFDHDFVLRAPRLASRSQGLNEVRVHSIDTEVIDRSLRGAISVGPLLTDQDFDAHPINKDLSLGGRPPFTNRRMARLAVYMTEEGSMHARLFDGRPNSDRFEGVTPTEAVEIIQSESTIRWGCFMDPGQTAKLYVQDTQHSICSNYGNRHYLQWPTRDDEPYSWVPDIGRPVASTIVLS